MTEARDPRQGILVDGYNVLLHPAYVRRHPARLDLDREIFIGLVRSYAARHRSVRPVRLVFDARDRMPRAAAWLDEPWLRVEFVPDADARIVQVVAASRPGVRVVTSDGDLTRNALGYGAAVESVEEFLARLRPRPRRAPVAGHARETGGKPAAPRGEALLREMAEQSAPREDGE